MSAASQNLWRILGYRFLAECFFIVPVMIPLFSSSGLTTTEIMIVESVFHVVVLLWEIPSGYIADVLGRRNSLLLGAALISAGLFFYALSSSFLGFCLAEVVTGCGFAFKSGADSALLFDSLAVSSRQDDYQKWEGRLQSWARIGTAIGSIGGGLMALWHLRIPFAANVATGVLMFGIALGMQEPPREKLKTIAAWGAIARVFRDCWSNASLRYTILLQSLLMCTGITGVWGYFLFYQRVGVSVALQGALFCVFQVVSGLGGRCSHRVFGLLGERRALTLCLVIGFGFSGLAIAGSIHWYPIVLANGFLWNLCIPGLMARINRYAASEVRATVLSMAGMSASVGYVALAPAFGRIVDRSSLASGFALLACVVLVLGSAIVGCLWHADAKNEAR